MSKKARSIVENYFCYNTRFGDIIIASGSGAIVSLVFLLPDGYNGRCEPCALTDRAAQQLDEYFAGKRQQFNLPLRPLGTAFQRAVWDELLLIPYGETRSYKQIAQAIGNPNACRAVGMANNKNPISIFIPCHRVVGSSGSLTGYGGGLDMKKKLLTLEQRR